MKKLVEDFLNRLELRNFNVERDGEELGIYFIILKRHIITIEERKFPKIDIDKEFSNEDKEINEFIKEFFYFKIENELEEFNIENLRRYEQVSNNNARG